MAEEEQAVIGDVWRGDFGGEGESVSRRNGAFVGALADQPITLHRSTDHLKSVEKHDFPIIRYSLADLSCKSVSCQLVRPGARSWESFRTRSTRDSFLEVENVVMTFKKRIE